MSGFYNKKSGKSFPKIKSVRKDMPGPKSVKSYEGKIDSGFYGHLSVSESVEEKQIRTSVTDYSEGC